MLGRYAVALILFIAVSPVWPAGVEGYYRFPDLHGEKIVFAAEGDLWKVSTAGGLAQRLTTHPGEESHPVISPDGTTLGFTASYEGPAEVYTMPLAGGLPVRRTYEGDDSVATTWAPSGELVYTTRHFSTLPAAQLVALDLEGGGHRRIPLAQASEGTFDADGNTLYFVRPAFHRNVNKRYRGGTARKIWKFTQGAGEAVPLTADYTGESHSPMWWQGRVYFITDPDGTMNIWSMDDNGGDLQQHTRHSGWDVRYGSLSEGRIVYQVGADLWLYDIAGTQSVLIPITLASDVDQWRDKWVDDPMEYLTSVNIHPEGESVVLTTRGRVFVAPAGQGRLVRASAKEGVRYRDATFMPDGEGILAFSDETGELEFVTLPATGVGEQTTLTGDGRILRFQGYPSPDGKWIAYTDKNQDLWLLEVESGEQKVISTNREGVGSVAWSPDSRWLTFSQTALNYYDQIQLYGLADESLTALTSDRVNSWDATWSPDGKWLYFLSDRELNSVVRAPWGPRQPEPFFDKTTKIYQIALRTGLRPPFKPLDELHEQETEGKKDEENDEDNNGSGAEPVQVELEGIGRRLWEVPVKAGDYRGLSVGERALFWVSRESGLDGKSHLMALEIGADEPEPVTLVEGVKYYDLAADRKKMVVHKEDDLYVFEAGTKAPSDLPESKVDLGGWSFAIDAREDWRQVFIDAWRLERDYFYDPGMHGVDWEGVRDKYLALVDRVTTRAELSDLIGRAVGELAALHTSVRGGDHRQGPDQLDVASLGARLQRDAVAGGYRIEHIYLSDPEYPDDMSPLADPELGVGSGDVILAVNGVDALSVGHIGELLRNQEKRQVRLRIGPASGGEGRDVIVVPAAHESSLRYSDWEYTRRLATEKQGEGKIGYVHLRAMGGSDLTAWYREFYPVFDRQGLIIDVRNNRGGNIDSIVLEKLLRRAWFYWKGREQNPYWNMQYSFRGHMVVLCNENTASDGEAFAEGFRRLGMGPLIGTRTWGGEIWLSSENRLTDRGLARAPMWGVYGPEGEWLIEGHGVEPDIEVDNLPHATFNGEDAQLDTAIDFLLQKIEEDPRAVPEPPPFPDKSFDYPD
jgi:tricorn protease